LPSRRSLMSITNGFDLEAQLLLLCRDIFSRRVASGPAVYLYLAEKYAERAGLELTKGDGPLHPAFTAKGSTDSKFAVARAQIIATLEAILALHEKFLDDLMQGANEDAAYQDFLSSVGTVYEVNDVKPIMITYIAKLFRCVCHETSPSDDELGNSLLLDERVMDLYTQCKQLPEHIFAHTK